jgi:hypothetical protein
VAPNGARSVAPLIGATTRKYGRPPAKRSVAIGSEEAGIPGRLGGGPAGTCTRGAPRPSRIAMKSAIPSWVTASTRGEAPRASVAQSPLAVPSMTAGSRASRSVSRLSASW